MFVIVDIGISL